MGILARRGIHDAGYAAGKAMAEAHARDEFVGGDAARRRGAAVLKPGPISGTRIVRIGGGAKVPLWAALGPLASVMRALPLPDAVAQMTPVLMDNVARAAVAAATEDSFAGAYRAISNAELIERFGDESSR